MSRFQRKPLPESRNPRASGVGAFDFAVTTTGEWIMLECNPFGAYGWLEDAVDLPITSALADLLMAGTTAR